jgi:hypothetical protein
MAEQDQVEASQPRGARDTVTSEISRLLKIVRRLEHENASLRRELATARPVAA